MLWIQAFSLYVELIWIETTFGHILRLPCLTYGNFSITKTEHKLTGHVLESFSNLSADECEDECLEHRACKSVNIKNTTGRNCELNSKSTEDPFDNVMLSTQTGWTYKATDYKEINIGHHCQAIKPCPLGVKCTDTCTCPGYQCHITRYGGFQSCQDAYDKGITETRVVPIHLPGLDTTDARCDMHTDGGGWIVFQRRVDATVDFFRGWDDYKTGFGDLNGNFWLGLEKIHRLAGLGKSAKLRVDLQDYNQQYYHAVYSTFEVSSEADGYSLKVGGFTGTAKDSLHIHNGMKFSTKDRDQDNAEGNCARGSQGAWWYNACYWSHLNGRYVNGPPSINHTTHMSWYSLHETYGGWMFSEMKFKYQ